MEICITYSIGGHHKISCKNIGAVKNYVEALSLLTPYYCGLHSYSGLQSHQDFENCRNSVGAPIHIVFS